MKLSEIKKQLEDLTEVNFHLQNGAMVPPSFHITEVGIVTKYFIDCGGTVRQEKVANFQLFNANDLEHRLKPRKLLNIIALSERKLGMEDMEIEVEYQTDTIGKYDLSFNQGNFILLPKHTACLASDNCGIPEKKIEMVGSESSGESCCTPGSGCC